MAASSLPRSMAAFIAAIVLTGAACAAEPRADAGTTTAPSTSTSTSIALSTSTSTTSTSEPLPSATTTTVIIEPPTTTTAAPPVSLVDQLVVAAEHLEGYDRDRFRHWSDVDHDRCNTRCEVLEAERRPDVGWVSIYDGFVTNDPTKLEIDHVVALAEAWRSGAWAWDDARREAFANDLDEPEALIAVSSSSNQSKADKDPAEWRPPARGSWCQWVKGWTAVKVKWGLTADPREVDAIRTLLADC